MAAIKTQSCREGKSELRHGTIPLDSGLCGISRRARRIAQAGEDDPTGVAMVLIRQGEQSIPPSKYQ
jgi:hypothetical protein